MGEHDRVATTGFSKMSDRQLGLWDIRNPSEPSGGFQMLDSISGVCMPFWDDGTQCLYLAGKGDGNIRYFEYENDKFEFLSQYQSSDPQRGIAFLTKRGVNTHENEVMRAFKTVNDLYIEPISFIVPRRAEVFQDDIYPPTFGNKPAVSGTEYFQGKDGVPPKIDLASIYAGEEPTEVASDPKPSAPEPVTKAAEPLPLKKAPEPVKEPAQPSPALRGPPPSMKEQTSSIADLASKFTDKDDDEEESHDDDTDSFEEVSKPIERHAPSASKAQQYKSEPSPVVSKYISSNQQPSPTTKSQPTPTLPSQPASAVSTTPALRSPPVTAASTSSNSAGPSTTEPLQGYLQDIKSLLEQQNATMTAQSEKISQLTKEVDTLKTAVGSSKGGDGEKDARIRALEKEVEGLRG